MAASETDLHGKPWNDTRWPTSSAIHGPKGMVGPEERACYYWLGRNWLSGKGCIVDAGCFVGASTFCFAAGDADGGQRSFDGGKLVHAFDYFKVVDKYVGEAISRDFRPIAEGQSYLDVSQSQTALDGGAKAGLHLMAIAGVDAVGSSPADLVSQGLLRLEAQTFS